MLEWQTCLLSEKKQGASSRFRGKRTNFVGFVKDSGEENDMREATEYPFRAEKLLQMRKQKEGLKLVMQDEFLDAYSEWLKTKAPKAKVRVLHTARELSYLDSEFRFCLTE